MYTSGLLAHLYAGQTANVRTDVESIMFEIHRGTKQGDPLSSLLFNCLLESIMRKCKPTWLRRRYGVKLGATDLLDLTTNLQFADDI